MSDLYARLGLPPVLCTVASSTVRDRHGDPVGCERPAAGDLARSRPCGHDLTPAAVCTGHAEALIGEAREPSTCSVCGVPSRIRFSPVESPGGD